MSYTDLISALKKKRTLWKLVLIVLLVENKISSKLIYNEEKTIFPFFQFFSENFVSFNVSKSHP